MPKDRVAGAARMGTTQAGEEGFFLSEPGRKDRGRAPVPHNQVSRNQTPHKILGAGEVGEDFFGEGVQEFGGVEDGVVGANAVEVDGVEVEGSGWTFRGNGRSGRDGRSGRRCRVPVGGFGVEGDGAGGVDGWGRRGRVEDRVEAGLGFGDVGLERGEVGGQGWERAAGGDGGTRGEGHRVARRLH